MWRWNTIHTFFSTQNENFCLLSLYMISHRQSHVVFLAIVTAGCYDPNARVPDLVKTPLPSDIIRDTELPKNYDPYLFVFRNHFLAVILTEDPL